MAGAVQKIRAEAERLEIMDKAAGILAELLYTEKLLTQIKEYRAVMLHVSSQASTWPLGLGTGSYVKYTISWLVS